ncbi:hypothetical protein AP285_11990 [Limnospira platensis YZ]|nr:hypothetical protein AP285_11990 [Arthrospira platensis YZ]BAI90582.1 hypothetical protein NIES39_E03550 [Arthrospira platensis NIES-39]
MCNSSRGVVRRIRETSAQDRMSSPLFTVQGDEFLWAAQQQMEERRIRRVVVTGERGNLVGIVTQTTLLRAFNPIEIYNLAENLKQKVNRLYALKLALWERRNQELQEEVAAQTQRIQTQAQRDRLSREYFHNHSQLRGLSHYSPEALG